MISFKKASLSMLMTVSLCFAAACGSGSGDQAQTSAPTKTPSATEQPKVEVKAEEVKIGAILSFSGPFASLATGIKNGMDLYFEQHNNMIGNRKVTIKYEDDELNPQTSLRKYRQLITNDKVDVVVGMNSSAIANALSEEVNKNKTFFINVQGASNNLSWAQRSDYIYRVALSNWQSGTVLTSFAPQNLGKKVFVIAPDFPAGHEVAAAFINGFKKNGGEVVGEAWPKQGTNDFATYISEISKANPDFVWAMLPGSDGIRFAQQFDQFGLKAKIPVAGEAAFGDRATINAVPKEVSGYYVYTNYLPKLDNAVNKKFVEDFQKKYNIMPDTTAVYGYDAAQLITKAIEKVGSVKTEDLVAALKGGITLDSPRGTVMIDAKTNNPIQNFYIVKNELKDGKIDQQILSTVEKLAMPETAPAN